MPKLTTPTSCFLLTGLLIIFSVAAASGDHNWIGSEIPTIEPSPVLLVDQHKHARILYSGLLVIPSVAGYFELFKRDLKGHRNRIMAGPWGGNWQRPPQEGLKATIHHKW